MSEIQDAIDRLSQAHGAEALVGAFQRLAATIRRDRKRQASEYGVLAQTIYAAMQERDNQRAAGATPEELSANLEKTIRACWPFVREWRFVCDACDDYGLRMQTCPGSRLCGREVEHPAHTFGTACWCDKGRRFRERPKTEASAVEAAARVKKHGLSKFGR